MLVCCNELMSEHGNRENTVRDLVTALENAA